MKNKKIIDISDNRTLLSKFSYLYAKINRLMNHFKKAALSAFAGQAAFFMILSFFPFFMFFPPIGKKVVASFVICTVGCSECSRMLHGKFVKRHSYSRQFVV